MFYLVTVLWPYVLVALLAGVVIGWFGSERNDP
jgi:hypothetical protein